MARSIAPAIVADGLAAAYGDQLIWRGASFTVNTGEFVAVLGPNGSGKRDAAEVVVGTPANAPHEGPIATAVAAVAGGLETAQDVVSTAATAVADGLGSASSYLHEKAFAEMATDVTALIRRYPVPSLLVGVGLGYILARLTTR